MSLYWNATAHSHSISLSRIMGRREAMPSSLLDSQIVCFPIKEWSLTQGEWPCGIHLKACSMIGESCTDSLPTLNNKNKIYGEICYPCIPVQSCSVNFEKIGVGCLWKLIWVLIACASYLHWSKKWQPTRGFFPGKFHGQKSLAG